jgi:ankyrin repeat protein
MTGELVGNGRWKNIGNQLCEAALAGNLEWAQQLLERGAPIDHRYDEINDGMPLYMEGSCWAGNTPLAEAIRKAHAPMVDYLLKQGASAQAPCSTAYCGTEVGDSPLRWWLRFALVHTLEEDGSSSQTLCEQFIPVGLVLVRHGADPRRAPREGKSVLDALDTYGLSENFQAITASAIAQGLEQHTNAAPGAAESIDRL